MQALVAVGGVFAIMWCLVWLLFDPPGSLIDEGARRQMDAIMSQMAQRPDGSEASAATPPSKPTAIAPASEGRIQSPSM